MVLRVEGKGIKGDDVSKMAPHAISSLVHGIYIPWLFLEGNPCWRPSLIHNQIWQRFAEAGGGGTPSVGCSCSFGGLLLPLYLRNEVEIGEKASK